MVKLVRRSLTCCTNWGLSHAGHRSKIESGKVKILWPAFSKICEQNWRFICFLKVTQLVLKAAHARVVGGMPPGKFCSSEMTLIF